MGLRNDDMAAALSFRNLPEVHLIETGQLNAYDVLVSDYVVFTQANLPSSAGSTPILRTLSLRLILSRRSVHVEAQALQP